MAEANGIAPLRVCVAEDDDDLRRVLKEMVKALGHTVVCDVGNGAELLEVTETYELDLALVDLDMPVLDGLEAAEALAKRSSIPVILLSGHPDLKHVVVEKEPVAHTLRKPVTLSQLEVAIQAVVSRPR